MASRISQLRKLGNNAAHVATRTAQTVQGGAANFARETAKRAARAAAKTAAKAALSATGVGAVAVGGLTILGKFRKRPLLIIVPLLILCSLCSVCMLISLILAEHSMNPLNWPTMLVETVGCAGFTEDDLGECTFEYSCEVVADRVGGDKSKCARFIPEEDEEDSPIRRRHDVL